MKPKDKATIITGTIANPSRPSVKFTALAEPIIKKIPKGIKNIPKSKKKFLKKGKLIFELNLSGKKLYIKNTIIKLNKICSMILVKAFNPLLFWE